MVKIDKIDYRGWVNSWRMSNGEVEVVGTGDVPPARTDTDWGGEAVTGMTYGQNRQNRLSGLGEQLADVERRSGSGGDGRCRAASHAVRVRRRAELLQGIRRANGENGRGHMAAQRRTPGVDRARGRGEELRTG